MKAGRFVAALAIMGGALACGAFDSSGSAAPVATSDAGELPDGGAPSDATPPLDSEADSAHRACTAQMFCDTFEGKPDVATGWRRDVEGASVLSLGSGHESGSSFRSAVQSAPSGGPRHAQLVRDFAGITSLSCHVWVRVLANNKDSDLFSIDYTPDGASATTAFVWLDILTDGVRTGPTGTLGPALDDKWRELSFTIETQSGRFDLSLDGNLTSATLPTASAATVTLHLGLYTEDSSEATAEYDDVVCDHP